RPECERMNAMVVVNATDAGEKEFAFIGFAITVCVCKHKYVWRIGDDDFVSENTDPECGVDAGGLVENSFFVRMAVPLRIFQDDYAISFRLENSPFLECGAIIDTFGHPNAAPFIDVDIGGIAYHGLGCKQGDFESIGDGEFFRSFRGGLWTSAGGIGSEG